MSSNDCHCQRNMARGREENPVMVCKENILTSRKEKKFSNRPAVFQFSGTQE